MAAAEGLPLSKVRIRLAGLWLLGAGVIVSLVFAQTIGTELGNNTAAVWEWLLPTVMPTIGTIAATLAATAVLPAPSTQDSEVRRSYVVTAEVLSAFYLLLILLLVVLKEKISSGSDDWLVKLHQANLLLGPLQGVIATTLGVLFLSKKQASE
jgi:hypothetical protein